MSPTKVVMIIAAVLISAVTYCVEGSNSAVANPVVNTARLLECIDDGGASPVLQIQAPPGNVPHEVWRPALPINQPLLSAGRLTNVQLSSLLSSTPSLNYDQNRQQSSEPGFDAPAPDTSGVRAVTIDDILPSDSPFLTDASQDDNITAIRDFISRSGIGRCGVESEWIDLGEEFFPSYFAGVKCEDKGCSVPAGQVCHPNFQESVNFLTVIHWHCCYVRDANLAAPQYRCGWRKAELPVLAKCDCSCSAIQPIISVQ